MKYFIIPLFIPHYGCRHNCVFCNQKKITGVTTPISITEVRSVIEQHLARITKERFVEIAYYGGSFTALPIRKQRELLLPASEALQAGLVHGIRLSTRPDCITPEIVSHLYQLGVSTIELGAQSLDDKILSVAERGHTVKAIVEAIDTIRKTSIKCGLQLMIGLPQEKVSDLIHTAVKAISLKPDFVRIYPTLVIAGTKLADLYKRQLYTPLSLEEAVTKAAYLKLIFDQADIPVIRIGLQATEELANSSTVLAGPYHPAFGELVEAKIFNWMITRYLNFVRDTSDQLIIHHHYKDSSKIRGNASANILHWQSLFGIKRPVFIDDGGTQGEIIIEYQQQRYILNRKMLS